jgi:hypothetical protein
MKNNECGVRRSLSCQRSEINPQIPVRHWWRRLTRNIQRLPQKTKPVLFPRPNKSL